MATVPVIEDEGCHETRRSSTKLLKDEAIDAPRLAG
jgi:hypothetical protein